jgi:hypothetical protein
MGGFFSLFSLSLRVKNDYRRRRCHEQLLRVNNSICIIESHSNAIEGTELNKSILNTIRASGDAIKRLSVKGGMSTVEDIISEVETQMENASEITKVISAGRKYKRNCVGEYSSCFGYSLQMIIRR